MFFTEIMEIDIVSEAGCLTVRFHRTLFTRYWVPAFGEDI